MLPVSTQTLHAALYRSIYILLTWSSLGTLQWLLVCYCECGSPSVPVTAVSWMLSVSTQTLHSPLYRSIYSLLTWCNLGKMQIFLGAFAKFRRASVTFVISARSSVLPSVKNNSAPVHGFSWTLAFQNFSKICRDYSRFFKFWPASSQALYVMTNVHLQLYLTDFS